MRLFSFFLITIILSSISHTSYAGVTIPLDTIPPYEIRSFDSLALAENRASDKYDYSIQRGEGNTLWDRIKSWLQNVLGILFSNSATGTFIEIVLYVLAIAAIVYALLKFSGIGIPSLIRKPSEQISYQVVEEDIHAIDFESEIDDALEHNNYRLALRLYYLWTLKILSDSRFINWQVGKTNGDYYYEISSLSVKDSFRKLSRLFEYGWYGGFKLNKPNIEEARSLHQVIKSDTMVEDQAGSNTAADG